MKKALLLIGMIFVMASFAVFGSACGSGQDQAQGGPDGQEGQDAGQLKIVTTIFPLYDWTRNILGENPAGTDLTLLLDSGVDLHSFQPTTQDMMKIADCDVLIYVGGESDTWVEDSLREAVNPDMIAVNLMDALGSSVREEETVPGMQTRGEEEAEELEYDEHVWLSPANAEILCQSIEEAIASADPENAAVYEANLAAYEKKIKALDRSYRRAVKKSPSKTLLFGDRFPFLYLTKEYGLTYYAAFAGCEAETEASFKTIRFLAHKLDQLGLPAVCTIEGSDQRLAETIISNTGAGDQKILTLNSMQAVTADDAKAGQTWLGIMEKNLEVLQEALQ